MLSTWIPLPSLLVNYTHYTKGSILPPVISRSCWLQCLCSWSIPTLELPSHPKYLTFFKKLRLLTMSANHYHRNIEHPTLDHHHLHRSKKFHLHWTIYLTYLAFYNLPNYGHHQWHKFNHFSVNNLRTCH